MTNTLHYISLFLAVDEIVVNLGNRKSKQTSSRGIQILIPYSKVSLGLIDSHLVMSANFVSLFVSTSINSQKSVFNLTVQ